MSKNSLAEKMAKLAFNGASFQKSWQMHIKAFGPILTPAFADCYQARVELCDALNKISRREIKPGLEKLTRVRKFCETDADNAAWFFFFGLGFEAAGAVGEMLSCYQQANEYRHAFYMPYLKVAKHAHMDGVFDVAEMNYRSALDCLKNAPEDEHTRRILGSAYANFAACLTMMHLLGEAYSALQESERILPEMPGRADIAAVLFAAMGDEVGVQRVMNSVSADAKSRVNDILAGKHPHFSAQPVNEAAIADFWQWFVQHEAEMLSLAKNEAFDPLIAMLQEALAPVAAFGERKPEVGIEPEGDIVGITLAGFYMVSLENAYEMLIAACPTALHERWSFDIQH